MSLDNGDVALDSLLKRPALSEGNFAPLIIKLDEDALLPSHEYVRVVALSAGGADGEVAAALQKGENGDVASVSARAAAEDAEECSIIRHDFALHVRGARFCRLLETMLDASEMKLAGQDGNNDAAAAPPSVVLPQATLRGCNALFAYLGLITSRVPSTISKPLRAPIEELVQPWEMRFLLEYCMDDATARAIFQQQTNGRKTSDVGTDAKTNYYDVILKRAPMSLNILLEVAMLSDFLLVESLRQLTCAFIASLSLNASSEEELLQLCGLERALTEEELCSVYAQFPFLRISEESQQ